MHITLRTLLLFLLLKCVHSIELTDANRCGEEHQFCLLGLKMQCVDKKVFKCTEVAPFTACSYYQCSKMTKDTALCKITPQKYFYCDNSGSTDSSCCNNEDNIISAFILPAEVIAETTNPLAWNVALIFTAIYIII